MDHDQEDCMGRIEPLFEVLSESLHHGMTFYQTNYTPEVIAQQRERTAANCVYDHGFHRMKEKLDTAPGCTFLNIRGLEVLNYYDLAVIRLKKLNSAGRWQNARTLQQKNFDDQLPLIGLPNAAVRLVVGYQPDHAFTAIDRIIVSRPLGKTIKWTAQIIADGEKPSWIDITPARLTGTEQTDFDASRRRH